MAGFSKANLRKVISGGQYNDLSASKAIASKIETKSPFEMIRGTNQILTWNDTEAEVAFTEDDFSWIEKQKGDKQWFPFLNEKSEPVPLGGLTRTKDMGGGSGSAAAPDPHELMTGALIYKYGSKGQKTIPSNAFNTG